ncbi:hypothetical protein ACFFX0_01565 [Citricoccus parietis]|uniref:Transposase n=1 Tax=Citricoccus parietis TaxID=592307 RepID=A0ABV5FTD8_9MICC
MGVACFTAFVRMFPQDDDHPGPVNNMFRRWQHDGPGECRPGHRAAVIDQIVFLESGSSDP